MTLSQPLIRGQLQNLSLSLSLTWRAIYRPMCWGIPRLYEDKLRIAGFTVNYDLADGWGGSNLAQATLSQGLDILGVRQTGSIDLSRADGHSDFTKLAGNVGRLQTLTGSVRVYAAAEGQYAWSPLFSSEQFGFGGQQFGRGYDASELTADNGVATTIERAAYSPPPVLPRTCPPSCSSFAITAKSGTIRPMSMRSPPSRPGWACGSRSPKV